MHVLARRWRPRGVTPVRLLDSRSEPLQAVATSLWQSRPNHARPNTSSPGDQACRKDTPFWRDSAEPSAGVPLLYKASHEAIILIELVMRITSGAIFFS